MNIKNLNYHFGKWMWYFFLFWVEAFLLLRFVLHFFAVGANGGFAAWVFNSTDAMMAPFRGVFGNGNGMIAGHPHFVDFQTLFVMGGYAVFAMLMWALLSWSHRVAGKKR